MMAPLSSPKRAVKTDHAVQIDYPLQFEQTMQSTNQRVQSIKECMSMYVSELQTLDPTSVVESGLSIDGFVRLEETTPALYKKVRALCVAKEIKPPTKSTWNTYQNYVHLSDKGEVLSYLCLRIYNMNRTPGSICVSVEIAVSIDDKHAMSKAIDSVIKFSVVAETVRPLCAGGHHGSSPGLLEGTAHGDASCRGDKRSHLPFRS